MQKYEQPSQGIELSQQGFAAFDRVPLHSKLPRLEGTTNPCKMGRPVVDYPGYYASTMSRTHLLPSLSDSSFSYGDELQSAYLHKAFCSLLRRVLNTSGRIGISHD